LCGSEKRKFKFAALTKKYMETNYYLLELVEHWSVAVVANEELGAESGIEEHQVSSKA
jgi:hypothetical protein